MSIMPLTTGAFLEGVLEVMKSGRIQTAREMIEKRIEQEKILPLKRDPNAKA